MVLSQDSHLGLLPLSFEPEDQLFYRTSFMTKIIFYTSVHLPILCFGPQSASAVRIIREEGLGLTFTENSEESVIENLRKMLSLTLADYQQFIANMAKAAKNRFDAFAIAHRFYSAMGLSIGVNGQPPAEPLPILKQAHEQ